MKFLLRFALAFVVSFAQLQNFMTRSPKLKSQRRI